MQPTPPRSHVLRLATLVLALAAAAGCGRTQSPVPTEAARAAAADAAAADRREATTADLYAFLSPHAARIDAATRPKIDIALAPMARDDVLASKVGGRPYWATGRVFPRDARGEPLVLLAQGDLAQLPRVDDGLPDSGLLQFFIAAGDVYGAEFGADGGRTGRGRGYRVEYWADTAAAPVDVPSPTRDADLLPHDPRKPRSMAFTAGAEPLTIADHRFEAMFDGGLYPATRTFADARGLDEISLLALLYGRLGGGGHKLGGHPFFTQQDPRTAGDGLELLLQLDTDDAMRWGDSGVGGFFITAADLAARNFDRAFYSWDCY